MPKLLLLDEPYTNLDRIHKLLLKQVLDEVNRLGISCMMISHEPHELLSWADSLIILRRGKVVQRGSPQHLYHSPRNAYVAALLGTYTLMNERTPGFGAYLHAAGLQGSRFVRPESLSLTDRGVGGKVQAIRFLGSHYEIEVDCEGSLVTLADGNGKVKVGDEVKVRLAVADE